MRHALLLVAVCCLFCRRRPLAPSAEGLCGAGSSNTGNTHSLDETALLKYSTSGEGRKLWLEGAPTSGPEEDTQLTNATEEVLTYSLISLKEPLLSPCVKACG